MRLESWGDVWRAIVGRITGRPTNFWWLEYGLVAGSSRPTTYRELEWLRKKGIGTVVSLTKEHLPQKWMERSGLSFHHFPIRNHSVPTLELVSQVSSIIDSSVAGGKPVLVHCSAGQGRSGCVLAAWLILSRGMSSGEAIETVRTMEKRAIEKPQEQFLRTFSA